MIEQYESSFLGNFSSALKKIFTLGKSGRNPRNYNDLVNFSEEKIIYPYKTQIYPDLRKSFSLPTLFTVRNSF
ncbi:hypothetical protein PFNF135_02236 [Plasmodium falciparum NF135/5.C10]|uniref:Uncharacterized protein n=1 Tax=Plasmodium falciparum NF135/5.C10 TaxID=1036726 RepID=W4IHY6_PLAFA|nr:hypothetical protein PFNF135_02236 [Plasmodium falciparum NF135/5.C10]